RYRIVVRKNEKLTSRIVHQNMRRVDPYCFDLILPSERYVLDKFPKFENEGPDRKNRIYRRSNYPVLQQLVYRMHYLTSHKKIPRLKRRAEVSRYFISVN
ncbi:unnamed protein product, partial [Heterotrigona itama]